MVDSIYMYPFQLSASLSASEQNMTIDPSRRIGSFYARMASDPSAKWLAAASKDGSVVLFDIESGHPSALQPVRLKGHASEVGGMDWSSTAVCFYFSQTYVRA